MWKIFVRITVTVIATLLYAFILAVAIGPLISGTIANLALSACIIALSIATYILIERAQTPNSAQPDVVSAGSMGEPKDPQASVKTKKLAWSVLPAAALAIAVLGAIFIWSVVESQQGDNRLLVRFMTSEAQKMIGDGYEVTAVSFPNGTSAYEFIASVRYSRLTDKAENLFTMIITGDCDTGCRLRMDPLDATRFALGKF